MPGDDDDFNLDPSLTPPAAPPAPPVAAPPAAPVVTAPTLPSPAPAPAPTRSAPDPDLKARIDDQASRKVAKQLKAIFGTDDPAEIERLRAEQSAQTEELARLRNEAEARKREQMTEVDQLREDLLKVTTERDTLKAQLEELKKNELAAKQNEKLMQIGSKFIKPNRIKHALHDFREHILSLRADDRKRFNEKLTENWFKKYSIDNPDFALPLETKPAVSTTTTSTTAPDPVPAPKAPAAPSAVPPLRPAPRLIGAPKPAPKPNAGTPPADPFAGYDPRPGRPNSMPPEMFKAYKKANGINV